MSRPLPILLAGALAFAAISSAAIVGHAQPAGDPDPIEFRRAAAARAIEQGRFADARMMYERILATSPRDARSLRDAGRVAHALGEFQRAAELLSRADAEITTPDPELHYLLGEALWVLGSTVEARAIHEQARTELAALVTVRLHQLWLARIHGRLGEVAAADRIYDALIAVNPADEEASLAQVEMHANARNWAQAERAVRRFLGAVPGHRRGQEMLAWFAEAQGHLDGELHIRKEIAARADRAQSMSDYGRALERSGNWAGALAVYRKAQRLPGADLNVTAAVERMDRRMSPELAAGMAAKSDPSATSIAGYVGMAVPFGRSHHFSLGGWHELASHAGRQGYGGEVTGALVLQGRADRAIVGAKVGLYEFTSADLDAESHSRLRPGAFGSAATKLLNNQIELTIDGELGSVWRETPRAVLEGGNVDSLTSHVFGVLLGHRLVIDTGFQLRRLRLEEQMDGSPQATQALVWAGADFALWTDFAHEASGQTLDDDLLRPTYLADSVVVAYRHYELWGETNPMFNDRMSLANRASIDEVSIIARKALARGRFAVSAQAGGGRDWVRELFLSRVGGSLWIAPSSRSRLSVSFDLAKESTRALSGERRSGWMTYHVDL